MFRFVRWRASSCRSAADFTSPMPSSLTGGGDILRLTHRGRLVREAPGAAHRASGYSHSDSVQTARWAFPLPVRPVRPVRPARPARPASPVSSPQPPHCAGRCCESAASSVSCPTHLPRRASPFPCSSHLPRSPAAGTYLRGGGAAWSFLRQLAAARIYPDNYSDPKRLYSFAPLVALRHTPIIP